MFHLFVEKILKERDRYTLYHHDTDGIIRKVEVEKSFLIDKNIDPEKFEKAKIVSVSIKGDIDDLNQSIIKEIKVNII